MLYFYTMHNKYDKISPKLPYRYCLNIFMRELLVKLPSSFIKRLFLASRSSGTYAYSMYHQSRLDMHALRNGFKSSNDPWYSSIQPIFNKCKGIATLQSNQVLGFCFRSRYHIIKNSWFSLVK